MTTNRMGLEQTLSDERLEELITELELCGIYGRQVRALAELQEFRKASKEARAFIMWPDGEPERGFIVDHNEDPAHKPGGGLMVMASIGYHSRYIQPRHSRM